MSKTSQRHWSLLTNGSTDFKKGLKPQSENKSYMRGYNQEKCRSLFMKGMEDFHKGLEPQQSQNMYNYGYTAAKNQAAAEATKEGTE